MQKVLVFLAWIVPLFSFSQTVNERFIGDKMPDIRLKKVYNFHQKYIDLKNDTRGLIILDFLSTGCAGCVEKLATFDTLQVNLGNKVKFIAITGDKLERVEKFVTLTNIGKKISHIPFVTEDTIMSNYFPHEFISHLVWIYNGKVVAITNAEYVNGENINLALRGVELNWPVKREVGKFDYQLPLRMFDNRNIPEFSIPKVSYYSSFSTIMHGIPRKVSRDIMRKTNFLYDSIKGITRYYMLNMSILDMYLHVLNLNPRLPKNLMILPLKNPNKLAFNHQKDGMYRADWNEGNLFCYESLFPAGIAESKMSKKILFDLNYYFDLDGRIEEKLVPVLELRVIDKEKVEQLISAKQKQFGLAISPKDLVSLMNDTSLLPVLDETNSIKLNRFIQIEKRDITSSFETLNVVLVAFGLKLFKVNATVDMLVITDKKE